jgi:hypothetical protein
MTVRLVLIAAIGFAACSSEGGPNAVCEREADNDPTVHELTQRSLATTREAFELEPDLEYARRKAFLACLRRHGLAPPGGVEPLRP